MRKYADNLIDTAGNIVSGATVTVYNTGTLVKPTIYSDDGVTPVANPVTTDSSGRFSFYVADGRFDLAFAGSGITPYSLADIEIADLNGSSSSADLTWKCNKIQLADGTAAAPSIGFQSATGTGVHRQGSNLSFDVAGTSYFQVNTSGHLVPTTTAVSDIGTAALKINNLFITTLATGATLTTPTITSPTITTPIVSAPVISGVTAMASATLSSTITNYNGVATVSAGMASEVATVDLTAQTAAITTTTLFAPATAGQYRLSWNAKVTTAAGTSSTLGALTVVYTDPDNVAQTITAPASIAAGTIATTSAANTTATVLLGMPLLLNCKAATNITYAFAYASNAANAMNYNLHLKLESLG